MTVWLKTDNLTAINPDVCSKLDVDVPTKTIQLWNTEGTSIIADGTFGTLEEAENWVKARKGCVPSSWIPVDNTVALNMKYVSKVDVDEPTTTLRFWRLDGTVALAERTFGTLAELQSWLNIQICMLTHEQFSIPEE